jgi:hypothetical protein
MQPQEVGDQHAWQVTDAHVVVVQVHLLGGFVIRPRFIAAVLFEAALPAKVVDREQRIALRRVGERV